MRAFAGFLGGAFCFFFDAADDFDFFFDAADAFDFAAFPFPRSVLVDFFFLEAGSKGSDQSSSGSDPDNWSDAESAPDASDADASDANASVADAAASSIDASAFRSLAIHPGGFLTLCGRPLVTTVGMMIYLCPLGSRLLYVCRLCSMNGIESFDLIALSNFCRSFVHSFRDWMISKPT